MKISKLAVIVFIIISVGMFFAQKDAHKRMAKELESARYERLSAFTERDIYQKQAHRCFKPFSP